MNRIDNPEEVVFMRDGAETHVFDFSWGRIDTRYDPIQWKTDKADPESDEYDFSYTTLADIYEQYKQKSGGFMIVVSETFLHGEVYRIGNYSDGKWWKIGTLVGFA